MLQAMIPYMDLRGRPMTDLLRSYPDRATALLRAVRRTAGIASRVAAPCLLPLADRWSASWLERTGNPYRHEIRAAADMVGRPGLVALNLSYEWACTSGVYLVHGRPQLLRILDWITPELGRHLVVAYQSGPGGAFLNVTWPGFSGMLHGLAPGRFAAALNLAPMRRHGLGLAGDWCMERLRTARAMALPAPHVLRQVFEQAMHYDDAKERLMHTPLATPAIFTLAGQKPGEGCIIERLEENVAVMELSAGQYVSATNEFQTRLNEQGKGWRAREIDSAGRLRQSHGLHPHEFTQEDFSWLRPPMLNARTRLVLQTDAATARLRVQGYEGSIPVTQLFERAMEPTGYTNNDTAHWKEN